MTTHLDIENVSDDNQKSLFRSQRLKISGKVAITPFRALDPSKFRSNVTLNRNASGFNEIYKELDSHKITSLQKSSFELDRFARDLNISSGAQTKDFNLCLMKFISKGPNPFPTIKEIEFLTDVAVSYSDLIPIPIIEVRIDDSNFIRFIKYIESSYDVIEELNQKPIMGALPSLPREQYPKLSEFYLDKGITTFYFDFKKLLHRGRIYPCYQCKKASKKVQQQ